MAKSSFVQIQAEIVKFCYQRILLVFRYLDTFSTKILFMGLAINLIESNLEDSQKKTPLSGTNKCVCASRRLSRRFTHARCCTRSVASHAAHTCCVRSHDTHEAKPGTRMCANQITHRQDLTCERAPVELTEGQRNRCVSSHGPIEDWRTGNRVFGLAQNQLGQGGLGPGVRLTRRMRVNLPERMAQSVVRFDR